MLTAAVEEKSVAGSRDSDDGGESTNVFKGFPNSLDESFQSSILENIDAALYENQIIFQKRIRKNQLTIQNLKLQDQLLSQIMDLGGHGTLGSTSADLQSMLRTLDEHRRLLSEAGLSTSGTSGGEQLNTSLGYLSTRDYENMCFPDVATMTTTTTRNAGKPKQWGNYVQNIQSSQADGSGALEGSFFGNTSTSSELAEAKVDDLYMVMQPVVQNKNKNILVETINQINESSPKQRPGVGGSGEFQCGIADDLPGGHKARKDANGKQVPGLYYNMNNVPLDSILESNCEDV